MGPVERAIEQLDDLRVDAAGVDLYASKELVPLIKRRRADGVEVKVRNLRFRICARLCGRDERYANSREDGCGTCKTLAIAKS